MFPLTKLVLDGKMFGKGDGFLYAAEPPSRRDICATIQYDSLPGKSFHQSSQSLSSCLGALSTLESTITLKNGRYKDCHLVRTTFEDNDRWDLPVTVGTFQWPLVFSNNRPLGPSSGRWDLQITDRWDLPVTGGTFQ